MPYVNYKRVTTITIEQIAYMLATDDAWLERAIVALHERQTELEKTVRTTYVKNEIGLQQADARDFSVFAEKIRKRQESGVPIGKCLSETDKRHARRPWHRSRVPQPTICKYRKQILDLIESAARKKLQSRQ